MDRDSPYGIVDGARRHETWSETIVELIIVLAVVAAAVSVWNW
jgi:hypothetical protein